MIAIPAKIKREEMTALMRLFATGDMGVYAWFLSKILREHGCDPTKYGVNIEGWIIKLK